MIDDERPGTNALATRAVIGDWTREERGLTGDDLRAAGFVVHKERDGTVWWVHPLRWAETFPKTP